MYFNPKLDKDLLQQKYPFNSSVARVLNYEKSNLPGPGTYDLTYINHSKKIQAKRKKNHFQFDWILSQGRSQSFIVLENNKSIGPNSYQIQTKSKSPKFSWGKSKRFEGKQQLVRQIGPGQYNYSEQMHNSGAKAAFASQVPKSIIFNSSNTEGDYKSNGVKELKEEKLPKHKVNKTSAFASQVPRINKQMPQQSIGPAYYNLPNPNSKIKENQRKKLNYASQTINDRSDSKNQQIGPGTYELNSYSLSKQISKKGCALSRSRRFESGVDSGIVPGPGYYMKQKYVFANPKELLKEYGIHRRSKSLVLHTNKSPICQPSILIGNLQRFKPFYHQNQGISNQFKQDPCLEYK